MKIELEVTDELIGYALAAGFAGGISYWARIEKIFAGGPLTAIAGFGDNQHPFVLAPLSEGSYVQLENVQGGTVDPRKLDRASIRAGLVTMAGVAGKHFGDLINGTGDATTGDIFIQCCVFGEVLYG